MIIYGTFTETSVPKLFIAGVIPGLIMTGLFMIYIAIHAKIVPSRGAAGSRAPRSLRRGAARDRGGRCRSSLLILGTLGGLYFGVGHHDRGGRDRLLPVDPARRHVRRPHLAQLIEAMHNTVNFSGNILFLILAAYIFSSR